MLEISSIKRGSVLSGVMVAFLALTALAFLPALISSNAFGLFDEYFVILALWKRENKLKLFYIY